MKRSTAKPRSSTPTLGRWGNSVGVRLPKHVVETSGFTLSDALTIRAEDGRIVIERRHRHITLADILKSWPKGEKLKEIDWGPARGSEV